MKKPLPSYITPHAPHDLRDYQTDALGVAKNLILKKTNGLFVKPTGSGKALMCGVLAKISQTAAAIGILPHIKALIIAPTRELVVQNATALISQYPDTSISIACSGLGARDLSGDVIVGSPGTLANMDLPAVGVLIIDEAHSVCARHKTSRINTIIKKCRAQNPDLLIFGLTATDFRLDSGRLSEHSGIWDRVHFEVTYLALMRRGFLAPLIGPGAALAKMDVSSVRRLGGGGDFIEGDLDRTLNTELLNARISREIVKFGKDRKSWLVFAISVSHAEALAAELRKLGVPSAHVHGGMTSEERDDVLAKFKAGKLRAVVNCQVLTTGFNHPQIDLVAMARPTCSPGLMVQCLGRGTRMSAGKSDCLILDFAGNFDRCGSFDRPTIIDKKRGSTDEKPSTKECPSCHYIASASATVCPRCDAEFPKEERPRGEDKLVARALNVEPLTGRATKTDPNVLDVASVRYAAHRSRRNLSNPPSLRIDYILKNGERVSEWLCVWHEGSAGRRAEAEWRARLSPGAPRAIPSDAYIAATVANKVLRAPSKIRKNVKPNGLITASPIFVNEPAAAPAPHRTAAPFTKL